MRHKERGHLQFLDHRRDGEGLAGAGGAEQYLMLHSIIYAIDKSCNGFGLVAHGDKGSLKFEFHRFILG